MTTDTGFKRYQSAIALLAQKHVMPAYEARKKGVTLTLPQDAAFQAVFTGLTEISSSIEALTLTENLLALTPPRSKRIKKDEYLKFLVAAYLQEVYILRERLVKYAKKIARLYAKHLGRDPAAALFEPLLASVDATLQGVTTTRGSHVHSQRFTDQDLDLVAMLSLVESINPSPEYDLRLYYSLASGKWHQTVKKNNAETLKLLDIYFDWLYPVVTKDGKAYFPPAGRPARKNSRNGA